MSRVPTWRALLLLLLLLSGPSAAGAEAEEAWLEGRIVRPPGTPADERIFVLSRGFARDDARLPRLRGGSEAFFTGTVEHPERAPGTGRAEVGPDGRFRAAFPAGSELGLLWLDARYLYLEEPRQIDLPRQAPITLAPRLGARVTGSFELPSQGPQPGGSPRPEAFEVQILGWSLDGDRGNHRASARVDEALRFDIGGLPPDLRYLLRANPTRFAPLGDRSLRLEAGGHAERRYRLRQGGRIRGRVVEPSGAPVAGAIVSTPPTPFAGLFFGGFGGRSATSRADGSFQLDALGSHRFSVRARRRGYAEALSEELEIGDQSSLEDLVLLLIPPPDPD